MSQIKTPARVETGVVKIRRGSGRVVRSSGFEGVVGFAVVCEVAHAVHGVFEEGRDGEDREANGRAGEGAGDGEDKTGGLTEEGQDADGFGVHTPCPDVNGSREASRASSTRHAALSLRGPWSCAPAHSPGDLLAPPCLSSSIKPSLHSRF
jgi:hypothetical protein